MKSTTTARFRQNYRRLSPEIRKQARVAYNHFKVDPFYPGLQFKRVSSTRRLYSARVNLDYRVIGVWEDDTIVWLWIGPHDEYDKILAQNFR